MNHLGTVPLETDRLFLRPFAISVAQAMFDNWASDPEVTRYLIWPTHKSIEVTQSVLSDWCSHYSENTFYQWAIVPKSTHNAPIGSISTVHIDESIQMVHIGYCLAAPGGDRVSLQKRCCVCFHFSLMRLASNA